MKTMNLVVSVAASLGRLALTPLVLAAAAALCLGTARASITFDAQSSTTAPAGLSCAWSHTVGAGADRMLVVSATTESNPDRTVTGVTYGSQVLTQVTGARVFNSGGGNPASVNTNASDLWYLPAPAVGTATITVTFSAAGSGGVVAGAVSLFGVVQGAPEAVATDNGGNNNSGSGNSTSITTLTPGAWLVDTVNNGGSGAFTATSGQTERWDLNQGSHSAAMGVREVWSGPATASWTSASNSRRVLSVAAFAPVDLPLPAADILTFGLPGNPATFDGTNISMTVPYEAFPLGVLLSPTFTLSGGATCTVGGNPVVSGAQVDFTSPAHYIVTSSDNNIIKDYTVTVTVTPASTACDILTFGLPNNPASISGTHITWTVPSETDLAMLAPVFTKSTFATCDQTSGSPPSPNFSTGLVQHYIVTAQDPNTAAKDYTVTVTVRTNPSPTIARLATSAAAGTLGDFDLTAIGTTDWVTFSKPGGNAQVTAGNRKSGGTAIANIMSSANNGGVSLGGDAFSYTNGTAPESQAATGAGASLNTEGAYRFFSFTLGISDKTGYLDVWYSAQQATTGTLSVTDGSTTLTKTLSTNYGDAASRITAHDRIAFTGAAGDTLTVTYSRTSGDYNGKIGLDAVALSMTDTLVQSTECDMLSFGLPGNPAVIAGTNITLTVPFETDLATLAPGFTTSLLSTCNQTSGLPPSPDFSTGLVRHYIVTAENVSFSKDYTVTVVVNPASTACDMLTFGLPGKAPAVISGTNITWPVAAGTDLATLAPVFTKSAFATCDQPSGSPPTPDFSTGPVQHYLVTAQDGSTVKNYTVTVIVRTNAVPTLARLATSAQGGSLGDFNLTAIGASDWVTLSKFNNQNQVAVANRKTGGTAIANVASSACYGGASLGGDTFSYTNGDPTSSASAASEGANLQNEGAYRFFRFTIDISNKSGTADIWYSVQQTASATLSVTDGYTTLTNNLATGYGLPGNDAASRITAHDRISFTGALGDTLTVTYSGSSADYGGKMGLDAVSVAFSGDVVPTQDFGTWAASKGLSGPAAAFDADPDLDGIPNGIEFVIGGEPNPANPGSNSAPLLPTVQSVGDDLVFTFTRSDDSAYLKPTVELSENLMAPWTTAVDPINATIGVVDGSPADTVTVTIPKNGATKLFARLKVVQPTP